MASPRTTGMAPTIVYRNDKPWIVTGAPGATGAAEISADAGNQLTRGTDDRLLVPGGYDFEGLVAATLAI